MCGISTTISSSSATTKSHGATFSHVAIGTWNASSAADERQRDEHRVPHQEVRRARSCAKRGLSGSAIDAE